MSKSGFRFIICPSSLYFIIEIALCICAINRTSFSFFIDDKTEDFGIKQVTSVFRYVSAAKIANFLKFIPYPSSINSRLLYTIDVLRTETMQASQPAAAPIHTMSWFPH